MPVCVCVCVILTGPAFVPQCEEFAGGWTGVSSKETTVDKHLTTPPVLALILHLLKRERERDREREREKAGERERKGGRQSVRRGGERERREREREKEGDRA